MSARLSNSLPKGPDTPAALAANPSRKSATALTNRHQGHEVELAAHQRNARDTTGGEIGEREGVGQ